MKTTGQPKPYCWCDEVVAAAKFLDLTPEKVNKFMDRKLKIIKRHGKRNFVR